MRALFDVSALLAVFDSDHTFHGRSRVWWAANAEAGWATCPIIQNGFVRIISRAGYQNRRSVADALEIMRVGASQPSHNFWPDDVSLVDPAVFNHSRILGPKQITDIYLLALAVRHDGRLVTFDQGIPLAAVRGAEARHLAVV